MIKIGIIGVGGVAQEMHLPYLTATEGGGVPGIEVVAICDVVKPLVEAVGKRYNIDETYTDYNEMLRQSEIDAVAVLTSQVDHPAACIDSMNAGKHVFVEKPLAQNVEKAEKIVEAQRRNDVVLEVGYMKRYDPGYLLSLEEFNKMKDVRLIRMHNIASHHRERGEVSKKLRSPISDELSKKSEAERIEQTRLQLGEKASPEEMTAYGMLLGVTSHDINALRGIFGDPKRVLATEIRHSGRFVTSLLDYGEAVCVYEFGFTNHKWWDEQIAAYSPEKNVQVIFPSPFLKNAPTVTRITEGSERTRDTVVTDVYEEAFRLEWVSFVDCVEKKLQPITSASDGKRDVEIIAAIVESHQEKKPVDL